ncbi:tetratricopeptide repeat-containing sensor histidine kinase [Flavobacterium channae]|uniref:tetratricopeptide repeat-containing sensor histidine kinase n=1 Tax=Flavobacterium channae TaxID=2897181 RepID=UPI001E292787|nr:tetratricopeptide repeat-containing sensor histidine kinase [Flavobacterium channae]UGS23735.1 tetratricopeptide repeat protein [Flavobacterium channae]
MKIFYYFVILIVFIKCKSNEEDSLYDKKFDIYLDRVSDNSLSKNDRLKNLDSAEYMLENTRVNDSAYRRNYFKIANRYFILLEYEKYKSTSLKILELSKLVNDSLNIAKSKYYIGDYYFFKSKNDSAYYYYLSAEKDFKLIDDKENLANTILHKAYILLYEKDFQGSETETIKVLDIAKKINDNSLIYECYVNLGSSLSGLGNYQKSLDYHLKALDQISKIEDKNYIPILKAQTLNNIGFVFISAKEFRKAKKYFQDGLSVPSIKEIHPVIYSSILDNLAYSDFKLDNKKGLTNFREALNIRDSIDDIYGKINSRIHLTEYYLTKKDTLKALQLNQEANTLAKESNYNKEVLLTLDFFTKLKPKEGLKYAKEYIRLSDSLQQQERLTRNKLARIEFETDEILVEKEAISNRFRIILISSLLIIFFGVLFYIILYLRGKHKELLFSQEQQKANEEIYKLMLDKQEEMDEVKKKEKLRISQELHDSVMNKLAGTRLNLFVLTKKRDEETIQKCLEHINGIQDIEKEIRTIAHELYNESFMTNGSYRSLLEQLIQNQKETYKTSCECDIDPDETFDTISALVKMNVYRILQETLNNINKHAKATKISLSLYIQNDSLILKIMDNGVGFNSSKSKNGIGLKSMINRAEAINGVLEIDSELNKGTSVCLKVKL